MSEDKTEFSSWLTQELEAHGWNVPEFARRAEIEASTVWHIIRGERGIGLNSCIGIARALKIPPETVLVKAGFLPGPAPTPLDQMDLKQLYKYLRHLTPAERQSVLDYARVRYEATH